MCALGGGYLQLLGLIQCPSPLFFSSRGLACPQIVFGSVCHADSCPMMCPYLALVTVEIICASCPLRTSAMQLFGAARTCKQSYTRASQHPASHQCFCGDVDIHLKTKNIDSDRPISSPIHPPTHASVYRHAMTSSHIDIHHTTQGTTQM